MLHTTVARLLLSTASDIKLPEASVARGSSGPGLDRQGGKWAQLAAAASEDLCGLRATFDELWFVEEQELLALALQGRYVRQLAASLQCGRNAGR